jgi:hypothetical protein
LVARSAGRRVAESAAHWAVQMVVRLVAKTAAMTAERWVAWMELCSVAD